jgi:hypothetical protein
MTGNESLMPRVTLKGKALSHDQKGELRQVEAPPHGHDLEWAIAALNSWFHNLHLLGRHQTAPDHFQGDFPAYKWQRPCVICPRI